MKKEKGGREKFIIRREREINKDSFGDYDRSLKGSVQWLIIWLNIMKKRLKEVEGKMSDDKVLQIMSTK